MKLKQNILHALYATLQWNAVTTVRQDAMGWLLVVNGEGFSRPNHCCSPHRGKSSYVRMIHNSTWL